jgi:hypothetical protein
VRLGHVRSGLIELVLVRSGCLLVPVLSCYVSSG